MLPIPLFLIAVLFVVASTLDAIFCYLRTERTTLFRHLSFIIRRNLPLIEALYTSSHGEPQGIRFPLRRVSRLLESGIPLADAINMGWPACPVADRSILLAAERAGTLPDALSTIDARYQREFDAREMTDSNTWGLSFITLFAFFVVYLSAMIFVIPKFRAIYMDFDVALPRFSEEIFLTGLFASTTPQTWYGTVFHGLLFLTLIGVPVGLFVRVVLPVLRRWGFFCDVTDSVRWFIPFFHRAAVADGCVLTLPLLRVTTAAGWPLDRAVDIAAGVRANVHWRQRLTEWANRLRAGGDMVAAGRAVGLPDMLLRYLSVGARDGDMEAPLAAAEQYYALLLDRHRRVISTLFWLTSTILVGIIVGCFCVAMVLSMAHLIDMTALTVLDV